MTELLSRAAGRRLVTSVTYPVVSVASLANPSTGGGWTPLALGDKLLEWWTADLLSSLTIVGGYVSAWRGMKNGYELTQASSPSRPAYSATGFGGRPCLTADGIDDFLSAESTFNLPIGNDAVDFFGIIQQDALPADTTARHLMGYGGALSTDRRLVLRLVDTGVNRARVAVGTGSGTGGVTGTTVDFSSRHLVRGLMGNSNVRMDVDGQVSGTSGPIATTASVRTRFFSSTGDSPANFWKGAARDMLFTAPTLTAQEVAALEAWGLERRML
ncbi:hypothetical protein [uncultured Devosia sp.]|uniref:hypothetical protein n=1 Tax=uncultured Devosia sp. TaxID=211434 RepID=UPI002632E4BE|nr:hypothetical protein [uncultured Devosia sp.]